MLELVATTPSSPLPATVVVVDIRLSPSPLRTRPGCEPENSDDARAHTDARNRTRNLPLYSRRGGDDKASRDHPQRRRGGAEKKASHRPEIQGSAGRDARNGRL